MAEIKGPLIYISYGIMKSGSTLAFELTKAILELSNFPQTRLSCDAVSGYAEINFVRRLSRLNLEQIEREARALGSPIVLKTHAAPTPVVEGWAKEGRIQGRCVYRDPREIALSMVDHGRQAREKGRQAFSDILSLDDAVVRIARQLPRFIRWSRLPGFLPLYYDEVAFATQATVLRLCRQMRLTADPAEVERLAKQERFTQYNKGVPGRSREMNSEDSERILQAFRSFHEEFIEPRQRP